MIISALVKRYEDTKDTPLGWQQREVSYALNIDPNGQLVGINSLEVVNGKKREKRKLLMPIEPPGRTSGIKAAFLCDNASYLLGIDSKRGQEKFKNSGELHKRILEGVQTPAAKAIVAYFEAGIPRNTADFIELKVIEKAVLIFQVDGKFVSFDHEEERSAWDKCYEKEAEESILCLATGKQDSPEMTHSTIKLYGGQSSGSYLISANKDSFTSYGKTVNDRASEIGKYAAFAYVTALNALLKNEKHRKYFGGDTLVYWAEKGGEAEEELFGNIFDPPKLDEDAELSAAMERIVNGNKVIDPSISRIFYLLCLSPNAARISVRFFYQCEFGNLIQNISEHYDRLEIVSDNRTPFRLIPLWLILSETTVKGSASDAQPLLAGQLLKSILTGVDYPLTLYNAIVNRIRAGAAVTQTKAAVIKAILTKNKSFNESEVTTVSLNEKSMIKPYVLGRLFSVLERLQEKANGTATIQSRYFTSACINPGSVFPTLLRLSVHHSAKLDNPVFFEKLKTDLLGRLDDVIPFPTTLKLDDQGRFILGYYHQTHSFFTKKDKTGELINE